MQLEGCSAIVTGGGAGLGRATALRLAAIDVFVVVLDRDEAASIVVQEALGARGTAVTGVTTDDHAVAAAVAAAVDRGPFRLVVNCAGGAVLNAPLVGEDGSLYGMDVFRRTLEQNLVGTFNVCRHAALAMRRSDEGPNGVRGLIVNVASTAAEDGQATMEAYAAAKAGVVGLTLPLARELAGVGIRVTTIMPGFMGTERARALPAAWQETTVADILLPKRPGDPEEFAMLVEHLARNDYINGTTIRLDGAARLRPYMF